ncbi:glycosyltransferase [Limosilactobacillus urinaemulieris]|uniref:glycosyltransferase n=1 Tax=Limosilactobacillus urinaemulieris TaxID=2742600 RepID=UPI001F575F1A|nr:glycosyltransferase [Limosilactobacillus urinaemulieris]
MSIIISLIIIILGGFSAIRIILGLLLANIHQIIYLTKARKEKYAPLVSVIIPAYNEEKTIMACVSSVLKQTYLNRQVIIVNDGSDDATKDILDNIDKKLYSSNSVEQLFEDSIPYKERFIVVNQPNSGKSIALNNGIKNYAKGELITVLDADSELKPNFLVNMIKHFQSTNVVAVAANVRIKRAVNLIELVQYIEYLVGYQLKSSEQVLNLEYIIGGIGSTFRRTIMEAVNLYDTDTVTEDIDLTMKLLRQFGNTSYKFCYAFNCIVFTPAVHNFKQLIKQRYRWKFGRFRALIKHRKLIFNKKLNLYSITLSWWKLPKVFFEEFLLLIEPVILIWMSIIILIHCDFSIIFSVLIIYFIFAIDTIIVESISTKAKLKLALVSPFTYLFLYIINIVDFICLVRCIANFKEILLKKGHSKWTHVER